MRFIPEVIKIGISGIRPKCECNFWQFLTFKMVDGKPLKQIIVKATGKI